MTIALLLRYWREAAIAALLLVLMAACHARESALKAEGIAIERYRVADSTLHVVRPQLARVDTLLVRDTVRVRVAVDRLVTFRDTVLSHLTDTVLVQQFVTRADSAAHACTELANDCTAFRTYATTTIAALESKVRAAPTIERRSHLARDLVSGVLGAAIGYGIHRR